MKTFNEFLNESGLPNRHKVQVTASKDGGPKEKIHVNVSATSEKEAKGIARLHLQKKGYTTHSAIHMGYDHKFWNKESVDICSVCGQTPCNCTHIDEQSPVAPAVDRKYIKGTPEWKAQKEKSKPRTGHPTNVKEESEQIDELSRDTLLSYANKVSLDSQKHSKDPTKRSGEKASRSVSGYAKAHNRLEKSVKESEESDKHYKEAEDHLSKANDADAKGDKKSFHAHMANHHDSMSEWHDSKGRSASADKHAEKADYHHEKSLSEETISELSTELLARYKNKAGEDASKQDKAGNFEKGHKRFKGIMKATFKQFANDAKK